MANIGDTIRLYVQSSMILAGSPRSQPPQGNAPLRLGGATRQIQSPHLVEDPSMSRNSRLIPVVLAAVALLLIVAPVDAGRKWCQKDPTFSVAGTSVPLYVSVYDDQQSHVTGPIAVTLSVPVGVSVVVTYVDNGFNGYGEAISVVTNSKLRVTSKGVQTQIQVSVPADISMPVQVKVAPANGRATSITGKTNTVISVNATIVPTT
ncbi:MAG TPA: hypothetical protein VEQ36_01345 [Thermomicrobiales bacterium]|nr:hypothetical protein [Thermomicrobiales bacterium]